MNVYTTNDENRFQAAQVSQTARDEQMERAIKIAAERRRVAQAAGYKYR